MPYDPDAHLRAPKPPSADVVSPPSQYDALVAACLAFEGRLALCPDKVTEDTNLWYRAWKPFVEDLHAAFPDPTADPPPGVTPLRGEHIISAGLHRVIARVIDHPIRMETRGTTFGPRTMFLTNFGEPGMPVCGAGWAYANTDVGIYVIMVGHAEGRWFASPGLVRPVVVGEA